MSNGTIYWQNKPLINDITSGPIRSIIQHASTTKSYLTSQFQKTYNKSLPFNLDVLYQILYLEKYLASSQHIFNKVIVGKNDVSSNYEEYSVTFHTYLENLKYSRTLNEVIRLFSAQDYSHWQWKSDTNADYPSYWTRDIVRQATHFFRNQVRNQYSNLLPIFIDQLLLNKEKHFFLYDQLSTGIKEYYPNLEKIGLITFHLHEIPFQNSLDIFKKITHQVDITKSYLELLSYDTIGHTKLKYDSSIEQKTIQNYLKHALVSADLDPETVYYIPYLKDEFTPQITYNWTLTNLSIRSRQLEMTFSFKENIQLIQTSPNKRISQISL